MLFACVFVPDFPVSAIVRSEPELRGGIVAVVEGKSPILSVVAANERARHAGIEIGMTKLQAEARATAVGNIVSGKQITAIRRRSPLQEKIASIALGDCARAMSPRVEEPEAAPDTVLLDISGMDRLFGTPRAIALNLARRATEVGLEANVAVSENLEAAICSARGFAGVTVIGEEKAAERIGPLGIDVLLQSAGIGSRAARELFETLESWGVRTCRAFAALPEAAVAERMGTEGVRLQKLARGECARTLAPTERAAAFEEAIELEYPLENMELLAFVLNRLIEQVCARLSARSLSTNELHLRMTLQPKHEFACAETGKYERSIRLPVPMLDAKTFLRLWQLELRGNPPGAPVQDLLLRAEAVERRSTQVGLFLPATPEPERLEITLARIAGVVRSKTAPDEIRAGSAEVLDTYAPDAFRMKRFVAGVDADEERRVSTSNAVAPIIGPKTVLRRLRPPVKVAVKVREGKPVIIRGTPEFLDCNGEIAWCAGPWRTSGEWWKDAWSREEWDLVIGNVYCRIYRDETGDWFLEGTYD